MISSAPTNQKHKKLLVTTTALLTVGTWARDLDYASGWEKATRIRKHFLSRVSAPPKHFCITKANQQNHSLLKTVSDSYTETSLPATLSPSYTNTAAIMCTSIITRYACGHKQKTRRMLCWRAQGTSCGVWRVREDDSAFTCEVGCQGPSDGESVWLETCMR